MHSGCAQVYPVVKKSLAELFREIPSVTRLEPTDQFLFMRGNTVLKVPLSVLSDYINPPPLLLLPDLPVGSVPSFGVLQNAAIVSGTTLGVGGDPVTSAPNQQSQSLTWLPEEPLELELTLNGSQSFATAETSSGKTTLSQSAPGQSSPQYLKVNVDNSLSPPGEELILENIILTDSNGARHSIQSIIADGGQVVSEYYLVEGLTENSAIKATSNKGPLVDNNSFVELLYYREFI